MKGSTSGKDVTGLITYMRTDSTREQRGQQRAAYISSSSGYLPGRVYATRPGSGRRGGAAYHPPDAGSVRRYLTPDQASSAV
jgi:hypothetical protein